MSGTTQEWAYDSPGGRRESEAAVREGLGRPVAAVAVTQVEAEQLMTVHVTMRRPRVGSARPDEWATRMSMAPTRPTPMTDVPPRQIRQQEFVATEPNRILSDQQMEYVNLAAELRQLAVSDPYLNGEDSRGRVNPTELQRLEEAP